MLVDHLATLADWEAAQVSGAYTTRGGPAELTRAGHGQPRSAVLTSDHDCCFQ